MDITEVNPSYVVGTTECVEESTAIGFRKIDVFFWRSNVSFEETAEV